MSLSTPSQVDVQSRDGISELPDPRVGQACIACRRKKVKCDGKHPCYKCSSRDQVCEYPGSRDNASASRYYATSFEARCQQMDTLCKRLEDLAGQLTHSINSLNQSPMTATQGRDTANEDLLQAAQVLKSMPELRSPMHGPANGGGPAPESRQMGIATGYEPRHPTLNPPISYHLDNGGPAGSDGDDDDDLDSDLHSQDSTPRQDDERETNRAGAMVKDSYGRLRFVGGATNNMLIEAVQSLSSTAPPSTSSMMTGPGGASHPHEPSDGVEIPFFIRGQTWPELPFLPKPEQLSRPPQYTADLLVGLYFEKLHYTFPVLFEPQFMQQYRQMCRAPSQAPASQDRRFLMVFFGVCACASSLISGSGTSERGFAGIEYYEKALLLYYASTGEASLERVQCLSLLSMCAAGWNTLTQSWILAAQAVRAALDIGLHLSGRLIMPTSTSPDRIDPSEFIRMQVSRRIWWSVYSLDRVTSICLGRPLAVHDEDCYCEMPLNMSDNELEQYCRALKQSNTPVGHRAPGLEQASSPLSGFLAFARLCRIAGRIQQLNSPHSIRRLASTSPRKARKFVSQVAAHDRSLCAWLESLPDDLRVSTNTQQGGPEQNWVRTMCVIVHAGSLLNLYRCFVGHPRHAALLASDASTETVDAVSQCMIAARNCINAAELVRDLVPPSHYLAICVHYLTLSGVVLLRMPTAQPDPQTISDVEKCVRFLRDLEPRWSGARRSRAIIEQLLAAYRNKAAAMAASESQGFQGYYRNGMEGEAPGGGSKRTYEEFEGMGEEEQLFWHQIPGSELFASESVDPGLFSWEAGI